MSSNIVTVFKEFDLDDEGLASLDIASLEKKGFRVLVPLRPVSEVVQKTDPTPAELVREIISKTDCDRWSLAAALGVSRQSIRNWTIHGMEPQENTVERIREAHKLATESPAAFVRTARAARAAKSGPVHAPAKVAAKPKPKPISKRTCVRLSDSRKLEIAVSYEDGATYAELAEKYGVSVRRITQVIREVAS